MRPGILLDVSLPEFLREQIAPLGDLIHWKEKENEAHAERIRAIYTYAHPVVDGPLLDQFEHLTVVSNFGVGVDHIDVGAASERGIAVGNTPGAVDGATADMTMALLLGAARNLIIGDRYARGPDFTFYDPSNFLGAEVHGSTLGIIGMGRIGLEVAKRARGFDMRILYHNRRRNEAAEAGLGVEYSSLEELLATSHFVTLNMPLTTETRHMIGESELRKMRSDALLINVARGGVVDHDALHRALSERWIAGAALDVTEPEPLPRGHELLGLDNLVIAPHLGSATVRSREKMGAMAAANLEAGLRGDPLPNPVLA